MEFVPRPLPGNFGTEILDLDTARVSDAGLRELLLTLYRSRFLVLRTGGLTDDAYVAFAQRLGEPIHLTKNPGDPDHPEIVRITNIGIDTKREPKGAAHWHTDQSFRDQVASVTMLYSVQAPDTGGATRFCDMAAAYDALPEAMQRRIEGLTVLHRHGRSVVARPGDHVPVPLKWLAPQEPLPSDNASCPSPSRPSTLSHFAETAKSNRLLDPNALVEHPLVRRHPITGQKTLYAITGTSQAIVGMEQQAAEQLLEELCGHALQERFLAAHAHRRHDLLMWDNPTTMHSATPIAAATGDHDTRLIHRISLRGRPPVFHDEGDEPTAHARLATSSGA